jgi:hypothetical protein
MASADYSMFIKRKSQMDGDAGFDPLWIPDQAFDFQQFLLEFAIRKGRSAVFIDCGMGKSLINSAFAENVVRKTNGRFLIMTPLAVSSQAIAEGAKFGVHITRSQDGKVGGPGVYVTNYQRLHNFDPADFIGAACDESSCLKHADAVYRAQVTEFLKKLPYRLLSTATPAPNEPLELGTSSEALGYVGHMDMLNRFFKNDMNNSASGRMHGKVIQWRFKGHAEEPFYRYVCSWSRVARKPSDLGFDDGKFILPPLIENDHIVESRTLPDGMLFPRAAFGMREEREERRRTITERCERVSELVLGHERSLIWCDLNPEGDLIEKFTPGCVQVSGKDSDDEKEEKLTAFANGGIRRLVTKLKIAGWGLNLQLCNHMCCFPNHSFEGRYQGIRRLWRFGQDRPVTVDTVLTEGEKPVLENQKRKAVQAERMFASIVSLVGNELDIARHSEFSVAEQIPSWMV